MAFSKNNGIYVPKNRSKYVGNVDNIVFRSNLEKFFFNFFDLNENVLGWNSEECVVPYISPLDGRRHRYFIDNWAKVKTQNGKIREFLIEIKPFSETIPPVMPKNGKITTAYINAQKTYAVNVHKWEAATEYAKRMGMSGFIKLTERDK